MKIVNKKNLHAGLIALVGVMTDVGAQLMSGTVNPTRAVLVGIIIGGVARIVGAMINATVASDETEPDAATPE